MVQVREALRRWLKGDGERPIARGVGVDRKTARRYITAAVELGVDRCGGEEQLTDELIEQVLEQLFSDEVQRRDSDSAGLRPRVAKLDPSMTLEAWDDTAAVTYDRAVWSELVSMRFVDQARNAFILGPVVASEYHPPSAYALRSTR